MSEVSSVRKFGHFGHFGHQPLKSLIQTQKTMRTQTLTLLQPLAAANPLAALFTDWLTALAPVERLTRTGRSDSEAEQTRAQLHAATVALHALHRKLTLAVRLLDEGAPLAKLAPQFAQGCERNGIGSRPAESFEPLLSLVALQADLTTRADLRRMLRYTPATLLKKYIQASSADPNLDRLTGLFLAVFDAAAEVEQDYYFLKVGDENGRVTLLRDLRGLLALDCFERV